MFGLKKRETRGPHVVVVLRVLLSVKMGGVGALDVPSVFALH